ncbi:MAG: GerMN domain-containing protein [Gemmatimonadota bacterium]
MAGDSILVSLRIHFHHEEELVEVGRSVRLPAGASQMADAPERVLGAALEALLRGPTPEERSGGIHSFFSAETEDLLHGVSVERDRAIVDFRDFRNRIPNAASSAGSSAFLAQLTSTTFSNSLVAEVEFRMEGSCEDFWAFLQRTCTVVGRSAGV